MKKIIAISFSLFTLSIFSMELETYKPNSTFIPQRLGDVKIYHNQKDFYVKNNHIKYPIKSCFVDKEVRKIDKEQLKEFLANGGYLSLNERSDGSYSLNANKRLPGGGVLGASIGAFLGKAAVYVVGHGAIQIVGVLTGPLYPVTVLALEGCLAVPIEAASMAGAVAGGIALGVATGPV
ncbi:MAG TPA: hypothetical protein VLB80_03385 [Candidatus Babeliales bacterium]|nr:hypothetical protein [Candidatus Babeliales bacterium]